jgi:hypothetical protein
VSCFVSRVKRQTENNTTQHVFFREVKKKSFSIDFELLITILDSSLLEIFPARQELEMIGLSSVKNGL